VTAVAYALYLMRRRAGRAAWAWLMGSMFSMLTWRLVYLLNLTPPFFFNPAIAIWGSTCLFVSMFLFGREITRREQAESQRDALLGSERAAREQAERANRFKDQFLGALSHELRTPLTAIIGWCELLRRMPGGQASTDVGEAVATIERNARAQARLIDDLLDVTRINVGSLRLEARRLLLATPVESAIQTVRSTADRKGIRLECDLDPTLSVLGDEFRLQQIAWNLLTNAIKFTPGGGRVSVRLGRLTSAASGQAASMAELVVEDEGVGIPEHFKPYLFTPFRQADGAVDRQHGGLGMGLSIGKSLIDLHGGSIAAASDGPGRGARFTVLLPLAAPEVPAGSPVAAPSAKAPVDEPLDGIQVLVVDDEPDIRTMLQRILEQSGAAVQVAASAEQATDLIHASPPDVLLSDIGMPGTDGYTFVRALRSSGVATSVKAIAVTAYTRAVDRQLALDSGFDAHLPKPIDAARLVNLVAELAARRLTPADS